MTELIRRPVSQVRAGDLIALHDEGPVYVVCAISQPLGSSRRVELVDARTGASGPAARLDLHDAVGTLAGVAFWHVVTNHANGSTEVVVAGAGFGVPADGPWTFESHPVEIDALGRPGWERLRRGVRRTSRLRRAA